MSPIPEPRSTEPARDGELEAIARVLRHVTHELNNVLGVVSGHLEIVAEEAPLDARWRPSVDAALAAALRAIGFVADVRDATRLDELPDRPEVDVGAVLAHALAPKLDGLRVRLHADPGCIVRVDADVLATAVGELVDDALATAASVSVDVVPSHDTIVIDVSDDGPGLPRDRVARAFEPFGTRARHRPGEGLRLARVYAATRSAGGRAAIASTPEGGTTVTLTFPRAGDDAATLTD